MSGAGVIGINNGVAEERPGKGQGHYCQQGATDDEKQDVLEPAFAGNPRRVRTQEHERTEGELLLRIATDQMEEYRACDGQTTQQKEWGKETHRLA